MVTEVEVIASNWQLEDQEEKLLTPFLLLDKYISKLNIEIAASPYKSKAYLGHFKAVKFIVAQTYFIFFKNMMPVGNMDAPVEKGDTL